MELISCSIKVLANWLTESLELGVPIKVISRQNIPSIPLETEACSTKVTARVPVSQQKQNQTQSLATQ